MGLASQATNHHPNATGQPIKNLSGVHEICTQMTPRGVNYSADTASKHEATSRNAGHSDALHIQQPD